MNKNITWKELKALDDLFHLKKTKANIQEHPYINYLLCTQEDMHEDVLFSILYISKTLCSLGRKLCSFEEERATCYLSM